MAGALAQQKGIASPFVILSEEWKCEGSERALREGAEEGINFRLCGFVLVIAM